MREASVHSAVSVAALWLVCLAVLVTQAADALSCNCNYGNVDLESPQCLCACYSGYLLPRCLYSADDMVPMEIWLNVHPENFYSQQLLQSLAAALPVVNTSQLVFRFAIPYAVVNKTLAAVTMKGDRAQQLIWDFYSSNSWIAEASIESVWERLPDLPANRNYGTTLSVYESSDGKILITVEGIMWLIGALCVASVCSMWECCLSDNTEEAAEEYLMEHHPALTDLVSGSLVPGLGGGGGGGSHYGSKEADAEGKVVTTVGDDHSGEQQTGRLSVNPMKPPSTRQRYETDPRTVFTTKTRR